MQEISTSCATKDLADTLTNIEKLSFSDVSRVDLSIGSPLPARDILSVNFNFNTTHVRKYYKKRSCDRLKSSGYKQKRLPKYAAKTTRQISQFNVERTAPLAEFKSYDMAHNSLGATK